MSGEDLELLRKAGRKDHEAFRRLVGVYQNKIFRVCLGFLKNPHDAEELTQDVFFQVYKNAAKFRGDSQVSTWIYRIAVNHSINRARKQQKLEWFRRIASPARMAPQTERPDNLLEQQERREILRKALRRLPENQQIAFTLHNVEGISYEEIARIMNCSVAAVESRIHRAKLNLQKYLVHFIKKRT